VKGIIIRPALRTLLYGVIGGWSFCTPGGDWVVWLSP